MQTETKKLKIIFVSEIEMDISCFSTKHSLVNKIKGRARTEFLGVIKSDKTFKADADLIIILNGSKTLGDSVITEACYAEIYFSDKSEKDFSQEDLEKAIQDFYSRKRNFGV